jgi:hypothetical protein
VAAGGRRDAGTQQTGDPALGPKIMVKSQGPVSTATVFEFIAEERRPGN